MPLEFHKMHGAGNDFVVIDARGREFRLTNEQAEQIADRRRGVGCDQILVLRDAQDRHSRLGYEIYNSDGSQAGQCGNGARCVGLYLEMSGGAGSSPFTLESPSGVVEMRRCEDGEYEVDMGVPEFEPAAVPILAQAKDGLYTLDSAWGRLEFRAVSMGNPHALVEVDDIDDNEIQRIGAYIGTHDVFPEGCNVGFAQLLDRGKIRLRVVERGAGETLACGSGACAAVAILRRSGQLESVTDVLLPGGRLVIKWPGDRHPILMKGPATHVFRGTMNE